MTILNITAEEGNEKEKGVRSWYYLKPEKWKGNM